jgi:hypothetical protein
MNECEPEVFLRQAFLSTLHLHDETLQKGGVENQTVVLE